MARGCSGMSAAPCSSLNLASANVRGYGGGGGGGSPASQHTVRSRFFSFPWKLEGTWRADRILSRRAPSKQSPYDDTSAPLCRQSTGQWSLVVMSAKNATDSPGPLTPWRLRARLNNVNTINAPSFTRFHFNTNVLLQSIVRRQRFDTADIKIRCKRPCMSKQFPVLRGELGRGYADYARPNTLGTNDKRPQWRAP